jgi:hypothetical protein
MYTYRQATEAYVQCRLDEMYARWQIDEPDRMGYDTCEKGYVFVHRDVKGAVDFTVEFTDNKGNARVTFTDGMRAEVCIAADDDDEDDEGADDDEELPADVLALLDEPHPEYAIARELAHLDQRRAELCSEIERRRAGLSSKD